jgi:hypothetical protein
LPRILRARATTPALLRARSGVSKKNTWRSCAFSGSIPSAATAERWSDSGTVSFGSMLSAPLASSSTRASSSSESAGRPFVAVAIVPSPVRNRRPPVATLAQRTDHARRRGEPSSPKRVIPVLEAAGDTGAEQLRDAGRDGVDG